MLVIPYAHECSLATHHHLLITAPQKTVKSLRSNEHVDVLEEEIHLESTNE